MLSLQGYIGAYKVHSFAAVPARVSLPLRTSDRTSQLHLVFRYHVLRMTSNVEGIKKTLNSYRDALVASNAEECASLYASDGVTMAQNFFPVVGRDAIKEWYSNCFANIALSVSFDIKEAVVVSEEYGFARTTSAGTQTINKTGQTSKEANQELFVMKKVEDEWKIARYCFCTTNPPK
ncbi:hypothetical protein LTR56_020809 [Elasticomyces elasticus]|nr:hypothetical protein LTR22_024935 [Elasticomyces elasticus]KAK3624756.1 hypothetical protein LTR56_020809 [Elasticomyces elasticus]KAK4905221.1 hypothetical protein LTR49_025456 [Elasticomyces elasticus]KAK5739218.1 hypothetical protein LTS12_025348 [Elasticomyces elasticus]